VQDKNTRFELALECGNLDVAAETARDIDRPECWQRLAQQALKQGNHKVSVPHSQRTEDTKLSIVGRRKSLSTDKKF
jgi:coatomer protein complex subunit alpha (xenin)